MARKEYTGAAPEIHLSGQIGAVATSITADTSSSLYPTGAVGNFIICIGKGTATEEKILCSARAGAVFTVAGGVAGRGADGTSAALHVNGETINHVIDAESMTEFSAHMYDTTLNQHTQYGRLATTNTWALSQTFSGSILGSPPATLGATTATTLTATGEIKARSGATQNAEMGASGPGGQSGIRLGSGIGTYDVNFYRESAGKGRMNGALQIDSNLYFADVDTLLQRSAATTLSVLLSNTERYKMAVPNGADTSGFYLTFDTGGGLVLAQVVRGAADSGGAGYRMLRATN